jgi:hypothetical protein
MSQLAPPLGIPPADWDGTPALDYQRFHRFLLAFPESALALLKLTVKQLLDRNTWLQTMSQ